MIESISVQDFYITVDFKTPNKSRQDDTKEGVGWALYNPPPPSYGPICGYCLCVWGVCSYLTSVFLLKQLE